MSVAGAGLICLALAGCGGGGPAHPLPPGGASPGASSAPADEGSAAATPGGAAARHPAVLAAVSSGDGHSYRDSGALVLLDPETGIRRRTLVASLVVGDAVQVSPDGSTVYYEKAHGCLDEIWSVPVAGGTPHRVVEGSRPALSADGARLAYATSTVGEGENCPDIDGTRYAVVVRTLANGAERRYPLEPAQVPLPCPVSHLSWNRDSTLLLVSVQSPQDNEGWGLRVLDPARDRYYLGERGAGRQVPSSGPKVPATSAGKAFFRQGVFLPGGDLFVVHRCCTGEPVVPSLERLEVVDPATGAVRRQVAIGATTKDHLGLAADATGRWLLYLAGDTVMVSDGGARPTTFTTGYQAVDW